jgi:hypothetical protein
MKLFAAVAVVALCLAGSVPAWAQQNQPAPQPGQSDIYHVHFTKAAPGQAAALGKALMAPDPAAPMPDHFVVLRHQEGDDWDYAVIQHLGPKASVDAAPMQPNPSWEMSAWHEDTFVTGPSWAEFTKAMGAGGSAPGGMVYTVGVHRTAPGHRAQLEKALNQPASPTAKIQTGTVFMMHVEGGAWTFLTITRHNSWQDFAADRAAAAADASAAGGWADVRQHSAFHRDTIADRIK